MNRKQFAVSVWKSLGGAATCVALLAGTSHAQILFQENFNSLDGSLGPSVNERNGLSVVTRVATDPGSIPYPNAFTHTGPAGWTVDNNFNVFGLGTVDDAAVPPGVPELGNPNYGVDEWEGWSFASKDFLGARGGRSGPRKLRTWQRKRGSGGWR